MGADSTELTSCWFALDAGATNLRVAVLRQEQILSPVWKQPFGEADRVEHALRGIREMAVVHEVEPPYALAIAWAGAPNSDGTGIERARYGPPLPDLVQRLRTELPLSHDPRIHSDARAAVQGGVHDSISAYGLISGTGLGEAWISEGQCWTRDQFLSVFGPASQWMWEGLDGEAWLRASSWWDSPEPPRAALEHLVEHRLQRAPEAPQVLLFGGHFSEWSRRGWLPTHLFGIPVRLLDDLSPLRGVVRLEKARLASLPS